MSYLALYRRFRPKTFDEVIGQSHIVTTLVNQIIGDKIGHAYLFCGARGTGKTSVAKIFARAVNCLSPINGSPCGKCAACQALLQQSNLDILEIDAASNNNVDNIRDIREKVQYPPVSARYKVYIVDEVHMLTPGAFNALLKTLEEPPQHAVFLLATTEPHKLPPTILSRCMRFDFKLVADKEIASLISSIYDEINKPYEKEAVALIAKSGEGSVRDALSIADVCVSYTDNKLTYNDVIEVLGTSDTAKTIELAKAILSCDVGMVFSVIEELTGLGKSVGLLSRDLLKVLRDILMIKTCNTAKEILVLPDSRYNELKRLSELTDSHRLLRIAEIFSEIENDLKYSTHPRVVLEAAAVKAAMPSADYNIDALIARVTELEKKLSEGYQETPREAVIKAKSSVKTEPQKEAESQTKAEPFSQAEPKIDKKEDIKPLKVEEQPIKAQAIKEIKKETVKLESEEIAIPLEDNDAPPFDWADVAKEPPLTPVENQIGIEEFAPTTSKASVEVKQKNELKNTVPDSRVWGTIIKKLRESKNIMLWVACQDLDAEVEGGVLTIKVTGENELNAIKKGNNLEILSDFLSSITDGYRLSVKMEGETAEDDFDSDVEKASSMLENVIIK